MIAWLRAGVGTKSSNSSTRARTPLASSTSSAVVSAGLDRPWVSRPMNNGPVIPCDARYSTIAWVMAAMCTSLNAVSSDEPRWPLVPKTTRCSGIETSGTSA